MPVALQTFQSHPMHFRIPQRKGCQTHFGGRDFLPLAHHVPVARDQLLFRLGMIGMPGFRPNQMGQIHAMLCHGLLHHLSCLNLFVIPTTVSKGWKMKEIHGIDIGVIKTPELSLKPQRFDLLFP